MPEVTLRVDATTGVSVRSGEEVKKHQRIGQNADGREQPCLCSVDGIVKSIKFNGNKHEFVVVIGIRKTE